MSIKLIRNKKKPSLYNFHLEDLIPTADPALTPNHKRNNYAYVF